MPTIFQTSVNVIQAPGVPGDFASADPSFSTVTSGGQLVAAAGGVTIGCFAWINAAQNLVSSSGTGAPSGSCIVRCRRRSTCSPASSG